MRIQRVWGVIAAAVVVVACTGPAATTRPSTAPSVATSAAPTIYPGTPMPPVTAPPATDAPPTDAPPTEAPPSAGPSLPTSVGEGEGALSVLAWPGYAEDGTAYPDVDWITPFEEETGCVTTVQGFGTSDEAFSLFTTNPEEFDVISASGDASLRLVRAGFVQPVNTDLVPSYDEIYSSLKDQPYNTVDGVHWGIPHGRGSNQLMWRTDVIPDGQTRWDQEMFNPDTELNLSVYDAPIYIADAAVELMDTQPELGITNPYALDDTQFAAAVALLQGQAPNITQYWTNYTDQMDAFRNGDVDLGTTWQVIANLLQAEDPPVPVELLKPEEGATGWSDTWMINSQTQRLNCAYKFVDYITSAEVNIQIAEWFGEAPGNSESCALAVNPDHCEIFYADDETFWENVWYWQTPEAQCVDGRTDVTCKDFDDWSTAWQELKG
ncbi:MAG: extracellular solute-binding protein [Candidatus Limnocylindrales bacterium]